MEVGDFDGTKHGPEKVVVDAKTNSVLVASRIKQKCILGERARIRNVNLFLRLGRSRISIAALVWPFLGSVFFSSHCPM